MRNYTYSIIAMIFIFCSVANAIDASKYSLIDGFYVEKRVLDFQKSLRNGTCTGKIEYPYLTNEDEHLFAVINDEIHDFVEIYAICNNKNSDIDSSHYDVSYEIPDSHNKDFFSIKWTTLKDGKLWRIDTLTFDRDQGDLAKPNQIFNDIARDMMHELAKLSEEHMKMEDTWSDFLIKIEKRDIQLYIENNQWVIVFNPTQSNTRLVKANIPNFFLKGDDVANSR